MVTVPSVDLDIYWQVIVTVPSVELDIYWSIMISVPSVELDTRVVRKVCGHPLYNSTGTMNSFIMYIIISNNVSGINMRKIM